MMDAGRHPNIEVLTTSEVVSVEGYVGKFKVRVLRHPRYVTSDCTACGECAKVCPVVRPSEFEMGLASRRAIHIPFPQAVPPRYIINMQDCLGNNPLACSKCLDACERKAINFDAREEELVLEVGSIILATGMDAYDPRALDDYGYTRLPDVITSMEFERLINAGGPSHGHLIRPSDGAVPRRIAFIQCVGSRTSKDGNPYCSNICCMNTVKDTLLIKEHWPDAELYVFYMDMRAFGKSFEDLYMRSRREGVHYVRGLPSQVDETPAGGLRLRGENTMLRELYDLEMDLVVLSVGLTPREDMDKVRNMLNLSKTSDGFFLEAHPKLRPVDTSTGGIFLAGTCESPKDIKDSVTQASAAAARASILMGGGEVTIEAITASLQGEKCRACGLCAKVCPYKAIQFDKEKKAPPQFIEAACAGCGTCSAECAFGAIEMRHFTDSQIEAQIDALTEESPEKKVLAFCCNWCSYAGADTAGTSRMQYPPEVRIIRTMCSGRVAEKFVMRAFERGIGAVLVSGCHFGDCHYIDANYQTEKRVQKLWRRLEKLGLDKNRLQLAWISAAEGERFSAKMKEMVALMKAVTPAELKKTRAVLGKSPAEA